MKTTLDHFGRLVIPKGIRDRLGLRPGVEIEIDEKENELVLRPIEHGASFTLKKGILIFSGEATGDLRAAVRTHREERLRNVVFGKKS